jgi:YfiH family protein
MSEGLVQVEAWLAYPWLVHGFSTRLGGVSGVYGDGELNLGFTAEDDAAAVAENRRRFVAAVGGDAEALVNLRQIHSGLVHTVGAADRARMMVGGRAQMEGDGLVTAEAGVLVAVLAADCVPVLLADTRLRVVAALHAGWRGTAAGIVGAGVAALGSLGSRPEDLIAAVGPSIGGCCYAVGEEFRERFAADLLVEREGELFLDLWEANRRQLVAAGVPSVTVLGECTACTRVDGRRKYFSHRAEKGVTGRAMGMVGVK